MEYTRPPPELNYEGPMDINWRNWRETFLTFIKASGLNNRSTEERANLLVNLMGPKGALVLKKLGFNSSDDYKDMDILIENLNSYFLSKKSIIYQRYIFFSSVKQHSESISQYVNTLKMRASTCNFGDLEESLIRDKIILDVNDKTLRKSLLHKPDLSLEQAVVLWEENMRKTKLSQICPPKIWLSSAAKPKNKIFPLLGCGKCGTCHDDPKKCPARGQKCANCGMLNHLVELCTKPTISNDVKANTIKSQDKMKIPQYFNPGPRTLQSQKLPKKIH